MITQFGRLIEPAERPLKRGFSRFRSEKCLILISYRTTRKQENPVARGPSAGNGLNLNTLDAFLEQVLIMKGSTWQMPSSALVNL